MLNILRLPVTREHLLNMTKEERSLFLLLGYASNQVNALWIYFNNALLNVFFFVSDFVLVHGMANAMGELDVNEAHRKLLGESAPVAHDVSEFSFGFAAAIFRKYFGEELLMTVVAQIKDAPEIDDLRYPFFV